MNMETTIAEQESPDDILNKFDPWNPYIVTVFMLASSMWIFSGLTMMFSAFSVADVCNQAENCTVDPNTINAEFDLIGDRYYLADWSTSAYILGNMIGALAINGIGDLKGRRLTMTISLFLMGVIGCVAAVLANNIYVFMVLRLVQGIFFPGCGLQAWNLAYESSPHRLRSYSTLIFGTTWVIGYSLVAPIAFFLPYWRSLLFACSVPSAIFGAISFYFIPESFSYMISQKDEKNLEKWIQRANKFGNRVDVNVKALIAANARKTCDETSTKNALVQIFYHKRILMYIVIMSFLWISDTTIYYGLSLFSTQLAGNKYLNYILSGLVEVPSNIASPWMLKILGRRIFVCVMHLIAAFAFLCSIFTTDPIPSLILWLIAKFAVICSFNTLYVYSSELFHIKIRSICSGGCEAVGRLAGTFAPTIHSLSTFYSNLPHIFFVVAAAISSGITLLLPETRDSHLPMSLSDIE